MGHNGGGNFIHARKIAQTRKQFDPEHEIQLMLLRTGQCVNKAAFLFGLESRLQSILWSYSFVSHDGKSFDQERS